jgi:glycosyltransferase involved in cell wall biosynthesis
MAKIVIDAAAARSGGGLSRTAELVRTLPAIAPHHRCEVIVRRQLIPCLPPAEPPVTIRTVPRGLGSPPLRFAWEHLFFPMSCLTTEVDWLLCPFGILPLRSAPRASIRTSVILSSVSSFAPEVWAGLGRYQVRRLRLLGALTRASVRRADRVFFLSQTGYRYLAKDVDAARAVFVPMSPPAPELVDAAARTELPRRLPDEPVFSVVGDLAPYKAAHEAIDAIGVLRRKGIPAQLVICGAVLDRAYGARLAELAKGIGPRAVSMWGAVPHRVALALLRQSVATVACSRVENPGRVTVEAMAVGAPVLAVDVPSSREACGEAAAYYDPGDVSSLARLMERCVTEPSFRQGLIERGRARIDPIDWRDSSRAILQGMDLL